MRSSSSSSVLVLGLLAFTVAACGSFQGEETPSGEPTPGGPNDPNAQDGPKAPPVGGPADSSELTNAFGVFVATSGADGADGTLEHPLARIQAGIDLAKKLGKRVYVCTGIYREELVLADSISIIGGLDCSGKWRTGAPRVRIEAPTSPAVRAKDIVAPTRLEGLEIVAPNATAPGSSSIALHADHASALVIASSKIIAGDATKGDDGTDGIQLVQDATANGQAVAPAGKCGQASTCLLVPGFKPPSTPAGTNACQGAATFNAESGGYGGGGGKWTVYDNANPALDVYVFNFDFVAYDAKPGASGLTSATGTDGAHGQNGAALGTISKDGYLPGDGTNGTDGTTGKGGSGGSGLKPQFVSRLTNSPDDLWVGNSGASGGAGGCPGLAGTAGKGGGASIAALLVESALTFDGTDVLGGRGGQAGLGSFGSAPTPGGQAGANPTGIASLSAQPGGRGGFAGVSGNGSTGPSIGIAHIGAAPKIVGATKIIPGAGGDAVGERTSDVLGTTLSIPATPAGLSKDILAL